MRTITIATAKGGAGKTTLTATLAVEALREGGRVALLDLNEDQGSLTKWWLLRNDAAGGIDNPHLVDDDDRLPEIKRRLAGAGFDVLLIDTPPAEHDVMDAAIAIADAVLIPCQPNAFDVFETETALADCRRRRKRFAFVLTAVDSRHGALTAETRRELSTSGPVLEAHLSYRKAYKTAPSPAGKAAAEIDSSLRAEAAALWREALLLAAGQ